MTLDRNKPKMELYLEALSKSGNVTLSCAAAGIDRATVYRWRKKYMTFAERWEDALDQSTDILAAEAFRRAIDEGSDRLLQFLLKAHRPEIYGDHVRVEANTELKVTYVDDWDEGETDE